MQTPVRQLWFRPTPRPTCPLPLGARSAGHYRLPRGTEGEPRRRHFVQLFWGVAGTGWIAFEGEKVPLGPERIALYFPGDRHHLGNDGDRIWEYYWWTMDGPLAESITRAFGLENGVVYPAGPPPVPLLRRLIAAIRDLSGQGERRAAALAHELLGIAAQAVAPGMREEPSGDFQAAALRELHRCWNDPRFGVDPLANALGMHRSRLSRLFQAAFGISPSAYLQRLRLQNALSLLKTTAKPIGEIARDCGWSDPNYFARALRRATGHSPREFRRE